MLHSIRFHIMIATLLVITAMLSFVFVRYQTPFIVPVFLTGALGGLCNSYLRMKNVPSAVNTMQDPVSNRLAILQAYISPLVAGILGILLFSLFLTGMITGSLFPDFNGVNEKYHNMYEQFRQVAPKTYLDAAKSLVWSFIAGFSERLVPNIIDKMAQENAVIGSNRKT
ncbi:MAG: hypothetical protein OEZ39_19070 [Gammaproteobacteria bacterium]|nr:hypothetical protein [Gammaproteobacteria bacterium]MDH5653967.1 hypothetical protein [Gammaproteobacteria bacterium]